MVFPVGADIYRRRGARLSGTTLFSVLMALAREGFDSSALGHCGRNLFDPMDGRLLQATDAESFKGLNLGHGGCAYNDTLARIVLLLSFASSEFLSIGSSDGHTPSRPWRDIQPVPFRVPLMITLALR